MSHMLAGCQLYQRLLGVLAQQVSGLSDLRADLRDLHTHISKVTHTHTHTHGLQEKLRCDWLLMSGASLCCRLRKQLD